MPLLTTTLCPIYTPGIRTTSSSITAFLDIDTKFSMTALDATEAVSSIKVSLAIPACDESLDLNNSVHFA